MTKNIARYGFKSGVLPKPRSIVPKIRAKFEVESEAKQRTGFADPAMVPKGSSPNPPGPQPVPAGYKLRNSAKAPEILKLDTEHDKYKALSSTVRRTYLQDALLAEEALEAKRAVFRQKKHDEALELRQKMDKVDDTEATRLTLPSIDQSLLMEGPMVRQRTPEEKRQLRLKRKANLVATRLRQTAQRDNTVLELYQRAQDFIITEEELEQKVDEAFAKTVTWPSTAAAVSLFTGKTTTSQVQATELELLNALNGTVGESHKPGLGEVLDAVQK